jgi:hypothetical protein
VFERVEIDFARVGEGPRVRAGVWDRVH